MSLSTKNAVIIVALTVCAPFLFCQDTAVVQITGVITDPNGAVVPRVQVKAIQTNTGFVRTTTTGPDGAYILNNLPVGPYRLEAAADGFKTHTHRGITLQVNLNPVIHIALQLGSLTQVVEVSASSAMVESQNTSISQVIDQQRVVDLPLNGRQATQLILLSGAAVLPPPQDLTSSKNYPSSVAIAVAGGQANGTYYLMDGGDHNDAFGYVNLPMPFPDAVQEFSVQTTTIPANYGVRAGAAVNIVTKSGSNEFHGNVFEFVRTGSVNARNFFAPARDNLKRNQFGGTVGGPIVRNKLFFFGGYQGTRIKTAPPTNTVFVPTAEMLSGNFRTVTSSQCGAPRTLLDPSNNQPFPNATIPVSRFNSSSQALLKYIPVSTDPCGRLLFPIPDNQGEDQFIGRADWFRSERHSLFGRYFMADFRNPAVFDGKNILTTTRPGVEPRVQTLVIGDTRTLNASTTNSLHFTWSRKWINRGPAAGIIQASDIGLKIPSREGNFPLIGITGRFNVSCGTCSLAIIGNRSFQFANDLNMIRGRHQISLGVDWIHNNQAFRITTEQVGNITFAGDFSRDATADFMLGLPTVFHQGSLQDIELVHNYFGAYVQDKFRVNSRLSLNLGFRWEPFLSPYDENGQANYFDFDAFAAGKRSVKFKNAPAGMFFPGDPGIPAGGTKNRLGNYSPRVGFIWNATGNGRTTIRSSYGLLYDFSQLQNWNRFGVNPPFASALNIFSPKGGFTDPYLDFPGGNPFPTKFPPPGDAPFPAGGQFVYFPIDLRPTHVQHWNLSIQRQVGSDWLFTGSYIGNKVSHRLISIQRDPAVYIPGNCGAAPCSTVANTNQRRILSRQRPADGDLISSLVYRDDGTNGGYNGLLVSANRRFSRNFSLLVNYTWSHCISEGDITGGQAGSEYQDPYNRAANRGNCISDIRHIFNGSLVAYSPRFQQRWQQLLFGDWQASGILTRRTGFWFGVASGRDASLTGVGADRPDLIADSHVANPTVQQWFNTAAYRVNAPGTYGNSGANSLQGPSSVNVDMALMRMITITERKKVELRFEAFNVLNHARFDPPRSGLNAAGFGSIATAADPRILQFALKFSF